MTPDEPRSVEPAGLLAPELWKPIHELDLPQEILDDLDMSGPEETGEILLMASEHLLANERPDQARLLLQTLHAHPPTPESGQYALFDLICLYEDEGNEKEANRLLNEVVNLDEPAPGPAALFAEQFEAQGETDKALLCFNIGARDHLALPAEQIAHLSAYELLPLQGRARVRKALGMPADGHDAHTLAAQEALPADPLGAGDPFDEPIGHDEEPPAQLVAVQAIFSRRALPEALERGWVSSERTEATYFLDAERELRAEAEQRPDVHFVVLTAEVGEVADFVARTGLDPSEPETLMAWSEAEVPDEADRRLPWPPERNHTCWCASGRKYKKCCGSPSLR